VVLKESFLDVAYVRVEIVPDVISSSEDILVKKSICIRHLLNFTFLFTSLKVKLIS
jgi:hypothetical protein